MAQADITRQDVLTIADGLFQEQGYDNITLADIATHAEMPIEVLERDFCCKDQIALAIYTQLSEQSLDTAREIDPAPISTMYHLVLEQRLSLLSDHSEVSSILFARAMRPTSSITASQLANGLRDPIMQAMQAIIDSASDTPKRGAEDLALFMYAFHFLVIVFWLYDRTEDKVASHMFTGFLRDLIKTLQPMLILPMLANALTKMAKIMMVIFGGARLVDPETTSN